MRDSAVKAICVDQTRNLQFRDIAVPAPPASGYVTVRIDAATINPGDKMFLKLPNAAGGARGLRFEDVWGASGAGLVTQIGADVPARYLGRKVAIYRSLQPGRPFLGLWCETAQVPVAACLLLPDHVETTDYSGALVNIVTAYAFLEQAGAEGHQAIVVTAGDSATGRAMAMLGRRRGVPTLLIVRSAESKAQWTREGFAHVLASNAPDFLADLERLAAELSATAVFDGVGGALISRMIGALPLHTSIFFYGFLAGAEDVSFKSAAVMMKDITLRRFSNFDSLTVREDDRLAHMLSDIEDCIDHPLLKSRAGKDFALEDFDAAMSYSATGGRKAVFRPSI